MLWTALASLAGRSRVATTAVTDGHRAARRGAAGAARHRGEGSLTGPPGLVNEPAACLQAMAASASAAPRGRGYGQRQRSWRRSRVSGRISGAAWWLCLVRLRSLAARGRGTARSH